MADLDLLTRSLARNVKRWRTERGFTLDMLAARAGVSRGMLIQIEQARTNPSIGTIVKIGDALGVSVPTLLDYERARRSGSSPPTRRSVCGRPGAAATAGCSPAPRRRDRWRCGSGG